MITLNVININTQQITIDAELAYLEKILDVPGIGSPSPVPPSFLALSHSASLHKLCASRLHIICEYSLLLCQTGYPQYPSTSSRPTLAHL